MRIKDQRIIHDCLNGNSKAFEFIVNKYLPSVYDFLRYLVKDENDANDLVQETFFKAWKNLSKFDKSTNFKAWIFTIAKNTAFNFLKKRKTVPFSKFIDEEGNNKLDEIKEEKLLIIEILEQDDLKNKLEKKLEKIPPNYQAILLLYYKDDFSLMEITEISGKPYNTVKSTFRRALSELKKSFME